MTTNALNMAESRNKPRSQAKSKTTAKKKSAAEVVPKTKVTPMASKPLKTKGVAKQAIAEEDKAESMAEVKATSKSTPKARVASQSGTKSSPKRSAKGRAKTAPKKVSKSKTSSMTEAKADPDMEAQTTEEASSLPKSSAKKRKVPAKAKGRKKTDSPATPKKEIAIPQETEIDEEPISLERGRQELENELGRTRKELDNLRAAMYSEVDVDPEEGDVEVSERLKNVTLIAMHEKRETALQEALSAISAGNYGICNRCKNSIGKARLEARPDAKFCVKCQEEIERAARRMA